MEIEKMNEENQTAIKLQEAERYFINDEWSEFLQREWNVNSFKLEFIYSNSPQDRIWN